MRTSLRHLAALVAVVVASTLAACGDNDNAQITQPTDSTATLPPWDAVAFVRVNTTSAHGTWQLGIVNTDGSNLRMLTDTLWRIYGADFSPDGRRIVFAGQANSDIVGLEGQKERPLGLWLINRDGSGLTRIGQMNALFPKWTPEGQRILFSQAGIWIVNADGASAREITSIANSDVAPVMSPDGRMIAFNRLTRIGGTDAVLWVMEASGLGARALAPPGTGFAAPSWSADSRRIAFVQGFGVAAINLDGSGAGTLSSQVPATLSSFAWRRDEKAVVYSGFAACCTGDANLHIIDLESGTSTRLTTRQPHVVDQWPSWGRRQSLSP